MLLEYLKILNNFILNRISEQIIFKSLSSEFPVNFRNFIDK